MTGSARDDVDVDGGPVRDDVEDKGACLGPVDNLTKLLVGRVAADLEACPDALEPVADSVVQSERSLDICIALKRRFDGRELDLPGGGDVDNRRGQARREGVEQVLSRIRAFVFAKQDARLASIEAPSRSARTVFLPAAVEVFDEGLVVAPAHPAVGGAELELRDSRLRLDRVECPEHLLGADAVADGLRGGGHFFVPPW